jgi:protein-S-isoprenylcysteine O-methyltransferase Ste14
MSRFLNQTLMPDERLVRVARFHGFYTLSALLLLAVCIGLGALLQHVFAILGLGANVTMTQSFLMQNPEQRLLGNLPFWTMTILGIFWFLSLMVTKWTTEIILTDKRFLYKRGIFSIRADKMSVREVNYCEIRQSLLGSLLNYGRIYIYTFTLDDQNIFLPAIAEPHNFSSLIEQLKKGAPSIPTNMHVGMTGTF